MAKKSTARKAIKDVTATNTAAIKYSRQKRKEAAQALLSRGY